MLRYSGPPPPALKGAHPLNPFFSTQFLTWWVERIGCCQVHLCHGAVPILSPRPTSSAYGQTNERTTTQVSKRHCIFPRVRAMLVLWPGTWMRVSSREVLGLLGVRGWVHLWETLLSVGCPVPALLMVSQQALNSHARITFDVLGSPLGFLISSFVTNCLKVSGLLSRLEEVGLVDPQCAVYSCSVCVVVVLQAGPSCVYHTSVTIPCSSPSYMIRMFSCASLPAQLYTVA